MPERHDLQQAAYQRDLELLLSRRLGPLLLVYTSLLIFFVCIDSFFSLRDWPAAGTVASVAVLTSTVLHGLRRAAARTQWLRPLVSGGMAVFAVLLVAYGRATAADPLLIGFVLSAFLLSQPHLFPWSWKQQAALGGVAFFAYFSLLSASPPTGISKVEVLVLFAATVLASVWIAEHMDLQRWTMYRQIQEKDKETQVIQGLLRLAQALDSVSESQEVLHTLTREVRRLLHDCEWCIILLPTGERHTFRVAAGDALRPDLLDEAYGLEVRLEDYDALAPLRDSEALVQIPHDAEPDARWQAIMAYFRIRAMMLTTMRRGRRTVGLLAVGRGRSSEPFSRNDRRIVRGAAAQAAAAIENAQLVADLRAANQLKSEFVATMSHELRTPLNIIIGYVDLLSENEFGELPEAVREVLDRIRVQSLELLSLIQATLDVSRLESRRIPVETTTVSLGDFLQELLPQLERLPRSPSTRLTPEVVQDGRLETDAAKLAVILRNLVSNALKFTPSGEVRLQVRSLPDGQAEFTVVDSGIGIPKEDLDRIFDMFYQVKRHDTASSGVGLGLYIVRRFVELLRGSIDVESEPNRGTTFRVRIPNLRAAGAGGTQAAATGS